MDLFFELIGYLAGICITLTSLPQAIQTFKTKNVEGLSASTFLIFNVGLVCWIVYGAHLHSMPMMIFNSLSLCFSIPVLFMIIKYRKNS